MQRVLTALALTGALLALGACGGGLFAEEQATR